MSRYGLPRMFAWRSGTVWPISAANCPSAPAILSPSPEAFTRPNPWQTPGMPALLAASPAPGLPASCTTRSKLPGVTTSWRSAKKRRGIAEPNTPAMTRSWAAGPSWRGSVTPAALLAMANASEIGIPAATGSMSSAVSTGWKSAPVA